jgi:hypothetical protein
MLIALRIGRLLIVSVPDYVLPWREELSSDDCDRDLAWLTAAMCCTSGFNPLMSGMWTASQLPGKYSHM